MVIKIKDYTLEDLKQLFETLNKLLDNHKNKYNIQSGNRILNLLKEIQRIYDYKTTISNNTSSLELNYELSLELDFIAKNIKPIVIRTIEMKRIGLIL